MLPRSVARILPIAVLASALLHAAAASALEVHSGDIFVSALFSDSLVRFHAIAMIDPLHPTTVVSAGGMLFNPGGIALASNGDLLVADDPVNGEAPPAIIQIDPTTGAQSIFASGGLIDSPNDVAVAPNGDVYVANGRSLIRLDASGKNQQSVVGYDPSFASVAVSQHGDVYLGLSSNVGGVLRVDPSSGTSSFLAFAFRFAGPGGVTVGPSGKIYATALTSNSDITEIDPVTLKQRTVTSGTLAPFGIATAPDGSLVVTDDSASSSGNGAVVRVDPLTGASTLLAESSPFLAFQFGIAVVPAPEPSPALLVVVGIAGLAVRRHRARGASRGERASAKA
jgi:DNA-binding beta-propeller fold protein YncE